MNKEKMIERKIRSYVGKKDIRYSNKDPLAVFAEMDVKGLLVDLNLGGECSTFERVYNNVKRSYLGKKR